VGGAAAVAAGTVGTAAFWAMKPLDQLEQRVSMAGAAVGVFMAVALNLHTLPFAGIGLAMALVIVAGAQRRSRLLAGAGSYLLAFGPWHIALLGTPFLLLGLWFWYRGRPSPEEIEARRQARDAKTAEQRAARDAKRSGRRRGGTDDSAAGTDRRPPERSKRYTPPARKR
jgi:hypothetical protein